MIIGAVGPPTSVVALLTTVSDGDLQSGASKSEATSRQLTAISFINDSNTFKDERTLAASEALYRGGNYARGGGHGVGLQ